MTLHTLSHLVDGLERDAAAPAVIGHRRGGSTVWSRGELGERARALAAGLRDTGVASGDLVGLLAPNQPEWVMAFLATVRAGAVAMPLSEQITAPELERIAAHSGCRRFFTAAAFVETLTAAAGREGRRDLDLILLDDVAESAEPTARRGWRGLLREDTSDLPDLDPAQLAALVYTSGTTGTPKGVPLSHRNLCANLEALLREQLAGPGDRVLLPLPLHHVYPLTVGLLSALAAGAAVVLPSGISGPEISRALADCRCTIMVGVPRLYEAMLAGIESGLRGRARPIRRVFQGLLALSLGLHRRFGRRLGRILLWPLHRRLGPALHLLASGGARLEPEIAWRLEGFGWQVLTGYGLTETAPILTFNPPGRARLDSTGLPVQGVELRIAAPEQEPPGGAPQGGHGGSDEAVGQGEIQARGANVFEGYWHNPEATAEAFTADGFFRTGDLGYLDAEGYLHIGGRSKELIVLAGGKNIFPEEVEAVYAESPLVHEVAVLEQGGRLVGLVVPEIETIRGARGEELRQRLRAEIERGSARLPSYQRIGDFAITTEALPRTQIGKLRRHELDPIFERAKAGAAAGTAPAELSARDQALLESGGLAEVWRWLEERFAPKPLSPDTSPQLDLGLDSFDWMSLTMELGERFGVQLTEDAIGRVSTLRDLLMEIQEAAQDGAGATEIGELSPEQARWLRPQSKPIRALAALLYALNLIVVRGLFRLRVEGREHLPPDGAYLLAPNHASYLDPFALGAALSWSQLRRIYWAGWTGLLFRGPLTRLFSRAAQVLPVDPERGLTSTLPLAKAALEQEHALCWFPEGARSPDGRLHRFLPGAGLLIERTGVPAVPVFIGGSFEAWPPGRTLPRLRRILVRFGRPIPFERDDSLPNGERHRQIADRLHDAVAALAKGDRAVAEGPV
ncbi:MAG TPA: AMP-binding protein [Geminicoccaceae bacterium]|nr:AMP-binding protein [Geminicoccaceae bacterium]